VAIKLWQKAGEASDELAKRRIRIVDTRTVIAARTYRSPETASPASGSASDVPNAAPAVPVDAAA
jgi:hypothetical protein